MGVLIDTGVFIQWERDNRHSNFDKWKSHGDAWISVITASELLVGVRRADSDERKRQREAFVEGILSRVPTVEINLGIARVHSEIHAELMTIGTMIGTHDLWIAATAIYYDYAVLTTNTREFERIADLQVLGFVADA